jgi:hypothetical protein
VTEYKDLKSCSCKLIINRTDLQEVLLTVPLFLHHKIFFLTETRKTQFNLAIDILANDIKLYDEIKTLNDRQKEEKNSILLLTSPSDYLNLPFFANWIIGFTLAEGSFFIKANNDGCFSLKQRIHLNLFEAFKLVFDSNRKISLEKDMYQQFQVSSKSDIQKVINFFSFSGHHPLIGPL